MKFYGVGVKLDGFGNNPRDILLDCLEYGFWCMGHDNHEKYEELISTAKNGDVVVAKAFYFGNPRDFCIRAIGFIMDTSIPENVPEDYKGKQGFTVEWTTVFPENLHLLSSDKFMPDGFMKGMSKDNSRAGTIYQETDGDMILKIVEVMNGPKYSHTTFNI